MKRLALIGGALMGLACAVIVVVVYQSSSGAHIQNNQVTISNETESFKLTSAQLETGYLKLQLKNIGYKPIISYHIDLKLKKGLNPDVMGDDPLEPGGELSIRLPLAGVPRDPQTGLYHLNVAMALFADGSAEGDWNKSQMQREKFEGAAMANEKIEPKLNSLDWAQAAILFDDLGTLRPPSTLSKSQQAGYMHAVKQARLKLQRIKYDSVTGMSASTRQRSFDHQFAKIRMFIIERNK